MLFVRSKRVSIVHRDMKPENILLSEKLTSKDAETVRVRVSLAAKTVCISEVTMKPCALACRLDIETVRLGV